MVAKLRYFAFPVLMFSLFACMPSSVSCDLQHIFSCDTSIFPSEPAVTLELGSAGAEIITANRTSATVSVAASSEASFGLNYDYVLMATNLIDSNWTVTLETYNSSNLGRLSNCTIRFHDGSSSDQIIVNNGVITQPKGAQYNLLASSTIYISMINVASNATGTSDLYVYLKIYPINTSPLIVYKIYFCIT